VQIVDDKTHLFYLGLTIFSEKFNAIYRLSFLSYLVFMLQMQAMANEAPVFPFEKIVYS
jgi:hypothetical protein